MAVLAAAGWLPTRSLAGAGGVQAMLAGLAVCWLGSAAGAVPVARAARSRELTGAGGAGSGVGEAAKQPVIAALAASAVRLATVVAGAVAVALAGVVPTVPLLVWTVAGHLALLVIDTRYAVGVAGTADRGLQEAPTAAAGASEAAGVDDEIDEIDEIAEADGRRRRNETTDRDG